MNFMKRWTTTIGSSFDWVMNQVENHDALVSASVREMHTAGAKAKVQLNRVKRDGETMKKRIQELKELESDWAERALRVHSENRERALECLRRKNMAIREIGSLENQLKEHSHLEAQLIKDLKVIDERIRELKRKQNTLNARQYRAEALKAGQLSELGLIGEIDEIFERWEVKLGQYDAFSTQEDNFEGDFKRQEDEESLEQQLKDLVSGAEAAISDKDQKTTNN